MEFATNIDPNNDLDVGVCYICGKRTWIYVHEIQCGKSKKKLVCEFHYLEFLKQYVNGQLSGDLDLFPKDLNILNIPLQACMIRTGTSSVDTLSLNNFLNQLDEKFNSLTHEIVEKHKNSDPFFLEILKKERNESELMKYLILAYFRNTQINVKDKT